MSVRGSATDAPSDWLVRELGMRLYPNISWITRRSDSKLGTKDNSQFSFGTKPENFHRLANVRTSKIDHRSRLESRHLSTFSLACAFFHPPIGLTEHPIRYIAGCGHTFRPIDSGQSSLGQSKRTRPYLMLIWSTRARQLSKIIDPRDCLGILSPRGISII
jgi:hypothetical protein